MAKLCPICKKHPLSRSNAKRCQRCYFERKGIKSNKLPPVLCVDCGIPIGRQAQRCLKCYKLDKQSTAAATRAANLAARELVTNQRQDAPREALITTFDQFWDRWRREIKMERDRYRGPAKPHKAIGKRKRILVLPDLHVPFHNSEMLADAVESTRKTTDLVISIGDFSDSYSVSRWGKFQAVPWRTEFAAVTQVMEMLSENFPEVRIVVGNHDARLRKALANQVPPDMLMAIEDMAGGTLNPLKVLARRYSNVEIASIRLPNSDVEIDWLHKEGDAILGHPERYSRTPGSSLTQFDMWLSERSNDLWGTPVEDIRLIVMGHTHSFAIIPWKAQTLLVECFCLCQNMPYQFDAKASGRPQRRGYITFDQVDGKTQLDTLKWRWLDVEDRYNNS